MYVCMYYKNARHYKLIDYNCTNTIAKCTVAQLLTVAATIIIVSQLIVDYYTQIRLLLQNSCDY